MAAITAQVRGLGEAIVAVSYFFYNYKLIVYVGLLLKLFFCKIFYTSKFLPYLFLHWFATNCFYVLETDVYNLFNLFDGYFTTSLDLFLYKFELFYYKSFILCDICVLGTHRRPICCHGYLTCANGKLGLIPCFGFVQSEECHFMII